MITMHLHTARNQYAEVSGEKRSISASLFHLKNSASTLMFFMIKVSVVLFPQLLGQYDSLVKEHEGLKVKDL